MDRAVSSFRYFCWYVGGNNPWICNSINISVSHRHVAELHFDVTEWSFGTPVLEYLDLYLYWILSCMKSPHVVTCFYLFFPPRKTLCDRYYCITWAIEFQQRFVLLSRITVQRSTIHISEMYYHFQDSMLSYKSRQCHQGQGFAREINIYKLSFKLLYLFNCRRLLPWAL